MLSPIDDGQAHGAAARGADYEDLSPYSPLLRSPILGQRMFDLLFYLRWNTSLPLNLNEFAILIIGRPWRSQVEWFAPAHCAEGWPFARDHQGFEGPKGGQPI
jgi:hypothetical protein